MSEEYIEEYSGYPGDEIVDNAINCLVKVETADFAVTGIAYSIGDAYITIETANYLGDKCHMHITKNEITKFSYKEIREEVIIPDVDEPVTREHILDTAKSIINGERQGTYGHAEDSFSTIAQLWTAYLKKEINSADVANMMILMKVARNSSGVYKEDNWIDICGYAALGGEIQGRTESK